eukprot:TRINITY_DN14209_c0_g1_i1.p1 TRINITY_DN14209_c0_g1~~TRINITY_DN14209_c0_g1_i1.p1  ORF type:complete len:480 (+),score=81.85 TRINITY_DN14209_c0_g1_i1:73-1512(+)
MSALSKAQASQAAHTRRSVLLPQEPDGTPAPVAPSAQEEPESPMMRRASNKRVTMTELRNRMSIRIPSRRLRTEDATAAARAAVAATDGKNFNRQERQASGQRELSLQTYQDSKKEAQTSESLDLDCSFCSNEKLETCERLVAIVSIIIYFVVGCCWGYFGVGWSIAESLYFVVQTFSTVGYGDLTLKEQGHPLALVLAGLFVFVGPVVIGAALGFMMDFAMEQASKQLEHLVKKAENELVHGGGDGEEQVFDSAREIHRLYVSILQKIGISLVILATGSAAMVQLENWSYAEAFYFSCATMTTVGYGDVVPQTENGKLFTSAFILVALAALAAVISEIGALPYERRKLAKIASTLDQFGNSLDAEELAHLTQSEELESIRTMSQIADAIREPHIDRIEFVIWQLLKQGKINLRQDVLPCLQVFDGLDTDGSGSLTQADIHDILELPAVSPLSPLNPWHSAPDTPQSPSPTNPWGPDPV